MPNPAAQSPTQYNNSQPAASRAPCQVRAAAVLARRAITTQPAPVVPRCASPARPTGPAQQPRRAAGASACSPRTAIAPWHGVHSRRPGPCAGRARARREARRRRGAAGAWAASAGADGQGRRGANADADQERERAARIASCEGCGRASGENSGWSGAASSRQTRKRDDAAPSRLAVVRDTHGGFVTLACRQAVISACRHLGLPLACRQAWMTAGKPSSRLAVVDLFQQHPPAAPSPYQSLQQPPHPPAAPSSQRGPL